MSGVRHIPSAKPIDLTKADERPSGVWRYSSHLSLVLGGGGARGAYQVGVLAGLAERLLQRNPTQRRNPLDRLPDLVVRGRGARGDSNR